MNGVEVVLYARIYEININNKTRLKNVNDPSQ